MPTTVVKMGVPDVGIGLNRPSGLLGRHRETQRIRVAAYCRVSTDMDMQKSSLELQIEAYQRIIDEHEGWVLCGIYKDQGISGTVAEKRPGFIRLMNDCDAGKVDYILAKSISRFARNTVDTLQYTRKLREKGIGVYFEKEGVDTLKTSSEILLTIHAAFAQEESHSISENVKTGIRHRFAMGYTKWCNIYGYRKIDEEAWQVHEEEAKTVRRIFDLYCKEYTADAICNILNKERIPAPQAEEWNVTTILAILRNEKYIGDVRMQKVYTIDHLTHKTVNNKNCDIPDYYKENNHEAIVDKETYELAQFLIALRDSCRGIIQAPYYGFLKCPECGQNMVALRMKNRTRDKAWICGGRKGPQLWEARCQCEPAMVKEKYIEAALIEAITDMDVDMVPPEMKEEVDALRVSVFSGEKITYMMLRKLVDRIDFDSWDTLVVSWIWGDATIEEIKYDNASDYPNYAEPKEVENNVWEAHGMRIYRKNTYLRGWNGKQELLRSLFIIDPPENQPQLPQVKMEC